MKTPMILALGAALLMGTSGLAFATSNKGRGSTNENSASTFAPGQRMQNAKPTDLTGPGASQFAPGQQTRTPATGPGASGFAPGQMKRDTNTTATTKKLPSR